MGAERPLRARQCIEKLRTPGSLEAPHFGHVRESGAAPIFVVAPNLISADKMSRKSPESADRGVLRCHKPCEMVARARISIIFGRIVNGEGLDDGGSEFELSASVSKLSDDSVKLCDIKMSCEALPRRPAFVTRSSGVFDYWPKRPKARTRYWNPMPKRKTWRARSGSRYDSSKENALW